MMDVRSQSTSLAGMVVRLVALSSLLGIAMLIGFHWERVTLVESIRVEGAHFTTAAELAPALDRIKGIHPDSIPYSEWLSSLNSLPYVDTSLVRIEANGTVRIRLIEREPIALLVENQRREYIDSEGVRLPIRSGKAVDVPLVYGLPQGDDAQRLLDFLTLARMDPLARVSLSEVIWNQEDGIIALSHENGVKLVFGSEAFEQRLSTWTTFYREVILETGMDRFNSIDLRFRGQVVTREIPKPITSNAS